MEPEQRSERARPVNVSRSWIARTIQIIGLGFCVVGLWYFGSDYWIMETGFVILSIGLVAGWLSR